VEPWRDDDPKAAADVLAEVRKIETNPGCKIALLSTLIVEAVTEIVALNRRTWELERENERLLMESKRLIEYIG
jgi:hypothetical protein